MADIASNTKDTSRMRNTGKLSSLAAVALALAACSSSGATPTTATATPVASASAPAVKTLTVAYGENAQVELIAPTGRRILIDVWNTAALSSPATASDILLTTHSHGDHHVPDFVDSFSGKKATFEEATLKLDDVNIVSVPAAHDEGQAVEAKGGSDYIFVIDLAGLRFAHFGDLGQDKLTDGQLAKIGKVDVAFSQLWNSFSSMDETNRKGFDQMNQVKPRLLITTHVSSDVVKLAPTIWKTAWATGPITISKGKLPVEMTCLVMGALASSYGTLYNIAPLAN